MYVVHARGVGEYYRVLPNDRGGGEGKGGREEWGGGGGGGGGALICTEYKTEA